MIISFGSFLDKIPSCLILMTYFVLVRAKNFISSNFSPTNSLKDPLLLTQSAFNL